MLSCNTSIIHERSNIIPIKKNLFAIPTSPTNSTTYSLKQNLFDPTKRSPPNDFMIKLRMRMGLYESSLDKKVDMRETE